MKLLLVVHKNSTALDAFVHAVREETLAGVTMIPSTGFGRVGRRSREEFHFSIRDVLASRYVHNTTLISIVPDERVPRLVELIEEHIPDIHEPGGGLYAVLPIDQAGGLD
jgi:nitrogen regulatory protein PII